MTSQMSLVDALLMSSAVKDKARNLVSTVPFYVNGGHNTANFNALTSDLYHPISAEEKDKREAAVRSFKEM